MITHIEKARYFNEGRYGGCHIKSSNCNIKRKITDISFDFLMIQIIPCSSVNQLDEAKTSGLFLSARARSKKLFKLMLPVIFNKG